MLHGAFAAILEDVRSDTDPPKEEASSRPRFFAGLVAAAGRRDEDAKKSIEHLTKQLRSSNAAAVERLRASEEQTLKLAQRLNDVRTAKKALTPKVLPAAAIAHRGAQERAKQQTDVAVRALELDVMVVKSYECGDWDRAMSSFEKLVSLYNGPSSNLAVGTSSGPDEGNNSTDEAAADTTPRPDAFPRGRLQSKLYSALIAHLRVFYKQFRADIRAYLSLQSACQTSGSLADGAEEIDVSSSPSPSPPPPAPSTTGTASGWPRIDGQPFVAKDSTERERLLQHLGRLAALQRLSESISQSQSPSPTAPEQQESGIPETLWPVDALLEPISERFVFHFHEERQFSSTNRSDRSRWFLSFLLNCARSARSFLEDDVSLLLRRHGISLKGLTPDRFGHDSNRSVPEKRMISASVAAFVRGLVILARAKVLSVVRRDITQDGLCRLVDQVLWFDRVTQNTFGYPPQALLSSPASAFPSVGSFWPRCVDALAKDSDVLQRWAHADACIAAVRYRECCLHLDACGEVKSPPICDEAGRGTRKSKDSGTSANRKADSTSSIISLLFAMHERHRTLASLQHRRYMIEHVQKPIINEALSLFESMAALPLLPQSPSNMLSLRSSLTKIAEALRALHSMNQVIEDRASDLSFLDINSTGLSLDNDLFRVQTEAVQKITMQAMNSLAGLCARSFAECTRGYIAWLRSGDISYRFPTLFKAIAGSGMTNQELRKKLNDTKKLPADESHGISSWTREDLVVALLLTAAQQYADHESLRNGLDALEAAVTPNVATRLSSTSVVDDCTSEWEELVSWWLHECALVSRRQIRARWKNLAAEEEGVDNISTRSPRGCVVWEPVSEVESPTEGAVNEANNVNYPPYQFLTASTPLPSMSPHFSLFLTGTLRHVIPELLLEDRKVSRLTRTGMPHPIASTAMRLISRALNDAAIDIFRNQLPNLSDAMARQVRRDAGSLVSAILSMAPEGVNLRSLRRELARLSDLSLLVSLPHGKLSGLLEIQDDLEQVRSVLAANRITHAAPEECLKILLRCRSLEESPGF